MKALPLLCLLLAGPAHADLEPNALECWGTLTSMPTHAERERAGVGRPWLAQLQLDCDPVLQRLGCPRAPAQSTRADLNPCRGVVRRGTVGCGDATSAACFRALFERVYQAVLGTKADAPVDLWATVGPLTWHIHTLSRIGALDPQESVAALLALLLTRRLLEEPSPP